MTLDASSPRPPQSGSRAGIASWRDVEMPKEPKGRRNRGGSAKVAGQVRRRHLRRRIGAPHYHPLCAASGAQIPKEPESHRNPGESDG